MKKLIVVVLAVVATLTTFAQKNKMQQPDSAATIKLKYTCPMHPDEKSNTAGKCTKCGMELKLSKKEQMKTAVTSEYSCPMHADVISDKPGTCSKCGMHLAKSKKEQMKMEVTKSYVCPMHADVSSDKPGKCSKCGMDLQKVKQKTKVVKA
jgi:transcription initiation factor IIE alpha subunit